MNEQTVPYTCPTSFFPADSKFPQHDTATIHADQRLLSIRPILGEIIRHTDELIQSLEFHIFNWLDISRRLTRLGHVMAYACTFFEPELQTLLATQTRETSTKSLEQVFNHRSPEIVIGYVAWDRYFRVIRVHPLQIQQFMAQVIKTSMEVLYDLPCAMIERSELAYMIRMVNMIFRIFYEQLPYDTEYQTSAQLELPARIIENQQSWSALWSHPSDQTEWDHRVGLYRWKVGHHFFVICAIFCQKLLAQASDAFEANDETRGIHALHDACLFLRGTTAAMWYANNFPLEIYKCHVRQTMVNEEALTGEEMIDYNCVKDAIDCLERTLFKKYGKSPDNWPEAVYNAYHEFGQTYVEDMEHHAIIAISKVGADTSLAQKVWQADLPRRFRKKTAADVLRDMMDLRRKRFGLL
jgi:hypothetical protein